MYNAKASFTHRDGNVGGTGRKNCSGSRGSKGSGGCGGLDGLSNEGRAVLWVVWGSLRGGYVQEPLSILD